ncbi:MAG TPA: iron donor protein CyaY [Burkholderiales bacterium]|nr:iron donor protein CyaY [Burkholderiales bacterium]
MTDAEFESLADATLAALERAIDRVELDVDVQTKGAGVLEIEFADGTKLIVNRHTAAREIWVAAKSGGFHFRHAGSAWRDTRDGTELYAALSRLVSSQSATPVILAPG